MHSSSLTLLGARTGNCFRVAIGLEEAQLPYEVSNVDLKNRAHRSPDFLAINADGKVPVLIARDVNGNTQRIITQSNAILFYLAEIAPGRLLPHIKSGDRPTALERYFYFLTEAIAPSHSAFALRTHATEASARRLLEERVLAAITSAERFVMMSPFMNGDAFGLADIAAVTIIKSVEDRLAWQEIPALRDWYDRARSRQSVVRGMLAFSQ